MPRPDLTTGQKAYLLGNRIRPWAGIFLAAVLAGYAAISLLPSNTVEKDKPSLENRVKRIKYKTHWPLGGNSAIEYKLPESDFDTVLSLVRVAEREIKRRGKLPYHEQVWEAALIDPRTGELDPRKFHDGFGWVDASSFADPYEIARNYIILKDRIQAIKQ